MKAVCPICEKAFELARLTFDEGSGVVKGKGESDFFLVPEHEPITGKKTGEIRSSETGEVIKTICAGSLRPQRILVH